MVHEPANFREVSSALDELDRKLAEVVTHVQTKADGPQVVRELNWVREELGRVRDSTMTEIGKLRGETAAAVVRVDESANAVIRSTRAENLRLLLAAMTSFAAGIGGLLALYATGKIG